MVVLDAPAPADALLPAAARDALGLVVAQDDCLPQAGWPALAAPVALFQLVEPRVVRVVASLQVFGPRFALVLEPLCARSAPLCAPVQETRVEAEVAWSQPPVGSSPRQAALQ